MSKTIEIFYLPFSHTKSWKSCVCFTPRDISFWFSHIYMLKYHLCLGAAILDSTREVKR